jgi:D-alanyl-D-alanine carboxypeptidase
MRNDVIHRAFLPYVSHSADWQRRSLHCIASVAIVLAAWSSAPQVVAAKVKSQSQTAAYDAAIASIYQATSPGATFIVTKDGKTVYQGATGLASVAQQQALKADDVMRIGSVTKQFTAVAILMLMEEGKLKLTDTVTTHLPDYPVTGKDITIAHLLTHTSGIPSYTDKPGYMQNSNYQISVTDLMAKFKDAPLSFPTGTRWSYNNSAYVLLGAIIEKISGQSYGAFLAKRIFIPLNMKDTAVEGMERSGRQRIAGYQLSSGMVIPAPAIDASHAYAAGAMVSTTADLARWGAALQGGKFLKPETWKAALTAFRLKDGSSTDYGYGWFLEKLAGVDTAEHGGGINGFHTYQLWLPSERVFVAVLSNFMEPQGKHVATAKRLAAIAIGKPFPILKAVKVDDATLQQHVGVYRINDQTNRIISLRDGTLYMQRTGGAESALIPASPTLYFVDSSLVTVAFERDAKGETVALAFTNANGSNRYPRTAKSVPASAATAKLSIAQLERLVGQFQLAPGFVITMFRDGEKLMSQATGQGAFELFPTSESEAFAKVANIRVKFALPSEATGRATGFVLTQNGRDMNAVRVADAAAGDKREVVTLTETQLDALVGEYQLAPNAVLSIRRSGKSVTAQLSGQPAVEIYPESPTKFFYKVVDAQLQFAIDASGNASQVTLFQNGQTLPAKRIK